MPTRRRTPPATEASCGRPGSDLSDVVRADSTHIQQVAANQFLLSERYYENVLTQARRSFDVAVVAAVVGLVFFLVAAIVAIRTSHLAAPVVSLSGGGVVEVVAGLNFWLYSAAARQLDSFHQRLERMQRFLVANSVASVLTGERREEALADLVRAMSEPDPRSSAPARIVAVTDGD